MHALPLSPSVLSDARSVAAYGIFFASYFVFALGKFPGLKIDRPGAAIIGAVLMVAFRIMGRSGSGKSTLLNLVSGIDRPDSGAVCVDGLEVSALGEPARTLFRRAHIGFVYQFFNLIPTLDVAENVRLVLELNGVRGHAARERSLAALGHERTEEQEQDARHWSGRHRYGALDRKRSSECGGLPG